MKKVSIIIAHRHATSFTLEDEFYVALKQIAEKQKISLADLVTEIDAARGDKSLSSAIRVYVLNNH
ncbi:MAG: ribbon-helix-helix domain-containing protein [Alphaproteobacteria bacterium]|nr:ribbon-helix-helix domain-containing protein [Alphaproteobacteria bacterium]